MIVDGVSHVPGPGGRVLVLGAGKASARIATTLEQLLGDVIAGGVVVAPDGHAASLDRIELLVGRPPAADRGQLPCGAAADAAGRDGRARATSCWRASPAAARRWPACRPTASASRRSASCTGCCWDRAPPSARSTPCESTCPGCKGGRLAAAMGGASVVNLTVSDVVGDPLDAITDPTVTDTTTGEQAIAVLHAYDLWDAVAPSIRRHLTATVNDAAPQLDDLSIQSLVLVTGADVANAMVRQVDRAGRDRPRRVRRRWRARAARSARRWPPSPSRSTTTAARSPGPACWSAAAARRP